MRMGETKFLLYIFVNLMRSEFLITPLLHLPFPSIFLSLPFPNPINTRIARKAILFCSFWILLQWNRDSLSVKWGLASKEWYINNLMFHIYFVQNWGNFSVFIDSSHHIQILTLIVFPCEMFTFMNISFLWSQKTLKKYTKLLCNIFLARQQLN